MGERNKKLILGGIILIALGLGGFGLPFIYELFFVEQSPQELSPAVQAQLPTFEDAFIGPDETVSIYPITSSTVSAPKTSAGSAVIKDRLVIAGVNINMPVFLGETEKTLNKGGWLFPSTSRPGNGGNSVIFGHRYMYRPPKSNTFWNLDKVQIGDEMVLYWQGKEYKYRVFESKIIEPTDLSVIQPTNDARLTVITCTPLFTTKQRLVITGSLISP